MKIYYSLLLLSIFFLSCNIESSHRLPKHYHYAQLSDHVYDETGDRNLPKGWTLYKEFDPEAHKGKGFFKLLSKADELIEMGKEDKWGKLAGTVAFDLLSTGGYYGRAYISKNKKEIIIAHRGTNLAPEVFENSQKEGVQMGWEDFLHFVKDLDDDLAIYKGELPSEQFQLARQFIRQIQRDYHTEYKRSPKISHTGHSLGAVLAELCAVRDSVSAVTFESPGSLPLVKKLLIEDFETPVSNILTYNAAPNAVNSVNPPTGKVVRLYPPFQLEALPPDPNLAAEKLDDYYLQFTAEQHTLDKLLSQFNSNTGRPKKWDWQTETPKQTKKELMPGFENFKNYKTNSNFWDNALKNMTKKNKAAFIKKHLK